MRSSGFKYHLEDEKILAYLKLSWEDRLKWLEEILAFTYAFQTPEERELREKIRRNEA